MFCSRWEEKIKKTEADLMHQISVQVKNVKRRYIENELQKEEEKEKQAKIHRNEKFNYL